MAAAHIMNEMKRNEVFSKATQKFLNNTKNGTFRGKTTKEMFSRKTFDVDRWGIISTPYHVATGDILKNLAGTFLIRG